MKERDYYLDTVRGLAAIMVIIIHTVWHSGATYVPIIVRNLSLLFEVPIFFFITGWSLSYVKNNRKYVKGIINLQLQYALFILITFIAVNVYCKISNIESTAGIYMFVKYFFHMYEILPQLLSLSSSLWYMKVYFVVAAMGVVVINIIKKYQIKYYALPILMTILTFVTFFYTKFYDIKFEIQILGYITANKKIGLKQLILYLTGIGISLYCINICTDINVLDIQGSKFPPNLIYMLWSLIGIVIVLYVKKYSVKFKKNIVSYIGENAIYCYFAQMISSSLLYYIVPCLNFTKWYVKVSVAAIINISMALILLVVIKYIIKIITYMICVVTKKIDNLISKLIKEDVKMISKENKEEL